MGWAMAGLEQPNPKHQRTTGGSAFYQVYDTSDGRHLVLGAQEMKFVRNLLGKLDRMEFVELCERGPGEHQQPLIDYFRELFRSKPLAHWHAFFADLDVSYAPVNTVREALDDESVQATGLVVKSEDGREHIMPVSRFATSRPGPS